NPVPFGARSPRSAVLDTPQVARSGAWKGRDIAVQGQRPLGQTSAGVTSTDVALRTARDGLESRKALLNAGCSACQCRGPGLQRGTVYRADASLSPSFGPPRTRGSRR